MALSSGHRWSEALPSYDECLLARSSPSWVIVVTGPREIRFTVHGKHHDAIQVLQRRVIVRLLRALLVLAVMLGFVSVGSATVVAAPPAPTALAPASGASVRLEYARGQLRVEATSSGASATLKAYVTSTSALIGTLSGGRPSASWPSNPQSVTVKSSLGGSAARTATAK